MSAMMSCKVSSMVLALPLVVSQRPREYESSVVKSWKINFVTKLGGSITMKDVVCGLG